MPSYTPSPWHRRTLSVIKGATPTYSQSSGRSPSACSRCLLSPFLICHMVMEKADRRETTSSFPRTRDHSNLAQTAKDNLALVRVRVLEPLCNAKRPLESVPQHPKSPVNGTGTRLHFFKTFYYNIPVAPQRLRKSVVRWVPFQIGASLNPPGRPLAPLNEQKSSLDAAF